MISNEMSFTLFAFCMDVLLLCPSSLFHCTLNVVYFGVNDDVNKKEIKGRSIFIRGKRIIK